MAVDSESASSEIGESNLQREITQAITDRRKNLSRAKRLARTKGSDSQEVSVALAEVDKTEADFNSLMPRITQRCGLSEKPPDGYVRLYRGIAAIWSNGKSRKYDYWSEVPTYAYFTYARGCGDLVTCDVPGGAIHGIGLESEVQLKESVKATLILRNGRIMGSECLVIPHPFALINSLLPDHRHYPPM